MHSAYYDTIDKFHQSRNRRPAPAGLIYTQNAVVRVLRLEDIVYYDTFANFDRD